MVFFFGSGFLVLSWLIWDSEQRAECVANCEVISIPGEIIPRTYNNCRCEIEFHKHPENRSNIPLKCKPHYRSLKFREISFGTVVLHKAVVRSCAGMGQRVIVNQTKFDEDERHFLMERNIVKHEPVGFRNNIMHIYRKPDGHLRFG
ncbi:unnamed protein product [Caenorhabditis angaria]|uniref:Uncharacterized protein n=1 Tax=Caenorhabditis angaria TaxID=860376 RepID=A0A9P1J8B0_9PELO|nr:unnamed protein product [Caenorhabditis angaria]